MAVEAFAHWKRLDMPGRDACWLERDGDGWTLYGAALFSHDRGPVFVDYNVTYDGQWSTLGAHLRGRIGAENFEHHIRRDGDDWTVSGFAPLFLPNVTQIDFGFTPATNYAHMKSMPERGADLTVAWFDLGKAEIVALPQFYRVLDGHRVDYQSPDHHYAATLTLADNGFVADYPGLWTMESDREPTFAKCD